MQVILLAFLVGSYQVNAQETGGEEFVSINGAAPTLEYDGYDASLSPELATGVMWTEGAGMNAEYGPMQAYPISAAELALRDDISGIFVDDSSSYNSFKNVAHDATWSGGGSYDAQGEFEIFESMYCDRMEMAEAESEGYELEECKSLCQRDVDCAAATFYPGDDTGMSPYNGCYHFISCDENNRKANAFGSTLMIKTGQAARPTFSTSCASDVPNDCDVSSTQCVTVYGGSGPSCECLSGFTPSSSPLSCDLIQTPEGIVVAVSELAGLDTHVNTMESHTLAIASVVGAVAGVTLVVIAAVVHLRSQAAAQEITMSPTANTPDNC